MRQIILFIGMIASAISGVGALGIGIFALFDGEEFLVGIFFLILVPSMMFALTITFKHVLDAVVRNEEAQAKLAKPASPTKPTSDTAGTPWATDPSGGRDD